MRHVIVGAGPAGVVAAETLRRQDPSSEIVILGDEPEPPYSRMALPYMLAENVGEPGTHLRHGDAHYEKLAIDVRQSRVSGIDTANRTVSVNDGAPIAYDRLLIATGAHPIKPPIEGMDSEGVENCWTLPDARRILAGTQPGSRVVLMGAGFIGCIVLEALAARGVDLVVVEMADRMLPRMMDETGGAMIARWCESKGVKVRTGTRVTEIVRSNGVLTLSVDAGDPIEADLVVCATGVSPNTGFLDGTGIECADGILVDHHLRTSADDVYAAGDVAQGPDFSTGQHEVHAIQPTAVEHGRIAALNMAGTQTQFRGSLSMNVLNTARPRLQLVRTVDGRRRRRTLRRRRRGALALPAARVRGRPPRRSAGARADAARRCAARSDPDPGASRLLDAEVARGPEPGDECVSRVYAGECAMRVQVTAAGVLEDYLPEDSDGAMTVDASEGATLVSVMVASGIPESVKPLISLNGKVVPRSEHATHTVSEGDAVHFMPNLKGG